MSGTKALRQKSFNRYNIEKESLIKKTFFSCITSYISRLNLLTETLFSNLKE